MLQYDGCVCVVSTSISSFLWSFLFFLFAYSVHLVCVPDSPSSAVNKQLGSMTLDEQPGASLHLFRHSPFPFIPLIQLIFFLPSCGFCHIGTAASFFISAISQWAGP